MTTPTTTDVLIIGAGASGLMCAATAGYRGRSVRVLEHTSKVGRKILMSGGGRCNFTNVHNGPANFLCENPHFAKSALTRYPAQAFIELVERHGIEFHEKTLGQLFCNESSREILQLLLTECEWAGVKISTEVAVKAIAKTDTGFNVTTDRGETISCNALVIATGGLSIPNGGATGFAYDVARQFGLTVLDTRAALVPFTLQPADLEWSKPLSGISLPVIATCNGKSFREAMLFTHRGLSGPAILQISSYWKPGDLIHINLLPDMEVAAWLKEQRDARPRADISTLLSEPFSKRLSQAICAQQGWSGKMAEMGNKQIDKIATQLTAWPFKPSGTEGYRTAEVTIGGIDTSAISSKTMEALDVPGLFFIGECLDVTGHLGGHNFQWAWASGVVAGQTV